MRIPSRLTIGAHRFTVEKLSEEELGPPTTTDVRRAMTTGRHFTYYGDCIPADQLIRLNKNIQDSMMAETLCHEVLHVLVELTGVRKLFKPRQEEVIVQALGHGLTQVLRDNPGFRRLFAKQ